MSDISDPKGTWFTLDPSTPPDTCVHSPHHHAGNPLHVLPHNGWWYRQLQAKECIQGLQGDTAQLSSTCCMGLATDNTSSTTTKVQCGGPWWQVTGQIAPEVHVLASVECLQASPFLRHFQVKSVLKSTQINHGVPCQCMHVDAAVWPATAQPRLSTQ